MRGEAGFSLIEMLVALAVMALATGMVILSGAGGNSLASETDRFIASLAMARDQALIENRAVAVEVSEAGYQASVRSRLGPVAPVMPPSTWEPGTSVAAGDGRLPVMLIFDPVGLAEPARFTLFRGVAREQVAIDTSGQIRRLSDDP